jgi:hypothetical protein
MKGNQSLKVRMRNWLFLAVLTAAAFLLVGCASEPATTRVVFTRLAINGQPVRMMLDTGAASSVLYSPAANRVGLNFTPPPRDAVAGNFEIATGMSAPARVTACGQAFTARLPVYTLPAASIEDGIIGWPEVRDNILAFDSAHRTIRGMAQLPGETAGWLKLKVRPYGTLLLETPLSNGKTGVILVDTGAPQGVQLPPAQWREFRVAHPEAPVAAVRHSTWSIGFFNAQTMWADEIKLGALTLTDVTVENMPAAEAAWITRSASGLEVAGVIGMRALMRMDLVVNGENGVAFLRPKPPDGERPVTGGNWSIAENVRLTCDALFVRSAIDYCGRRDFDAAITDYTRALELNPDNPDIYVARALARQIQGDFLNALADYDKAIELNPDDFEGVRLLRQTLLCRLGRPPEDFSATVAVWKNGWFKTIGLFLADQLDEKALLEAAGKMGAVPALNQQCEAFYYIGIKRLCNGDKAGARDFFQRSVATGVQTYTEYQFANAELARLDASIR